jgi:hypothetical protein
VTAQGIQPELLRLAKSVLEKFDGRQSADRVGIIVLSDARR